MILAAEAQRLVGADVMQIRRPLSDTVPQFFQLMRRQYTAQEWLDIETPPALDDQLVSQKTRKEQQEEEEEKKEKTKNKDVYDKERPRQNRIFGKKQR